MMKYSVRHYAHARCGIVRFGREWLDKQPRWIMAQFPWFLAKDLMIEDYVRARIAETGEWSHMQKSEAEDATTKR
jgi:hypothetical protein